MGHPTEGVAVPVLPNVPYGVRVRFSSAIEKLPVCEKNHESTYVLGLRHIRLVGLSEQMPPE